MTRIMIESGERLKKGAIAAEILRLLNEKDVRLRNLTGASIIEGLLPKLTIKGIGRKRANSVVISVHRLRRLKLIEILPKGNELLACITEKGVAALNRYKILHLSLKASSWDKKWRIVLFDIPEYQKINRDRLVRKLKQLGFMMLKGGVFLHYLPCTHEIEEIANQLKIEKRVTLIEAVSLGGIESEVINHFRL